MKRISRASFVRSSFIFSAAFLFYTALMTRGVSWGDGAIFALWAKFLTLHSHAESHPLYILLGHLVIRILNSEDPATALTLLSVIFSAGTLAILDQTLEEAGISKSARTISVVAFGLSHVFWLHAEITEVYSMNVFFVALVFKRCLHLQKTGRDFFDSLLFFLLGLSLCNHLMMVWLCAAVGWMLLRGCRRDFGAWVRITLFFLLGSGFYIFLLMKDMAAARAGNALINAAGGSFIHEMFKIKRLLIGALILFPCITLYQFPVMGILLPRGWKVFRKTEPVFSELVMVFFIIHGFFFFQYGVKDQFVFLLPLFYILVFPIAFALSRLPMLSGRRIVLTVLALALLKTIFYAGFPVLIRKYPALVAGLVTRENSGSSGFTRNLPYRDDFRYFLFPPKVLDHSASRFASEVFRQLPKKSFLLSDWNAGFVLNYYQRVLKTRPDVMIEIEKPFVKQVQLIRRYVDSGDVYLVTDEEGYYPVKSILKRFTLKKEGILFRVRRRPEWPSPGREYPQKQRSIKKIK